MFKCYLKDINTLKSFLKAGDSEYVDVLLNKGTSLFINNSNSMFGCLSMLTEVSPSFTPVEFRMPVKILKNIAVEGYFYVEDKGDEIATSFYTSRDNLVAKVVFVKQNIFTDSYSHKLELLRNIKNYSNGAFKSKELHKLCKISKTSGGIISCNKGVVGSSLSGRGKIFYVPEDDNLKQQSFAIMASSLSLLMSVNDKLISMENFICATRDSLTILATKCNGDTNEEYAIMELAKAKFRCKIDLTNIVTFIRNMGMKVNSVDIDIVKKMCIFDENNIKYETPFVVKDLEQAPKAELDAITIPVAILNEMYSGMDMRFVIEKKKNFTKISNENVFVYF